MKIKRNIRYRQKRIGYIFNSVYFRSGISISRHENFVCSFGQRFNRAIKFATRKELNAEAKTRNRYDIIVFFNGIRNDLLPNTMHLLRNTVFSFISIQYEICIASDFD